MLALTALPMALFLVQQPEKLFFLLLFSIPLSFEFTFSFGISTDLPDEPLMLALSLVSGCIVLTAQNDHLKQAIRHPLSLLLVFQVLWAICLLFYSTFPLLSAKFLAAKIWYLIPLILLPQVLLKDQSSVRRLALAMLLPTLFVAIYTLSRHALRGFSFTAINESLYPFFRNHVSYAASLSFALCITLIAFLHSKRSGMRLLTGLMGLILIAAIFFSYTRGTWLSVILSLLGWALFRYRLIHQTLLLSASILILGFLVMSLNKNYLILKPDYEKTVVHTSLSRHLHSMYKLQEISGSERLYRWIAGVRMIAERPLQGFGPATFYSNYKQYTDSRFKTWVSGNPEKSSVHNYFLLTWIEQGIPGFLLFLIIIGYFFHRCHRLYFRLTDPFARQIIDVLVLVMMNILVINFFSDLIETDKVGAVFFLCLGLLIWLDGQAERGRIA